MYLTAKTKSGICHIKAMNLGQQTAWTDCGHIIKDAVIETNKHLTCKRCSSEWRETRMPSA